MTATNVTSKIKIRHVLTVWTRKTAFQWVTIVWLKDSKVSWCKTMIIISASFQLFSLGAAGLSLDRRRLWAMAASWAKIFALFYWTEVKEKRIHISLCAALH